MIKTLKFASDLVPLVLSGDKTTTWRLFDDKDLKADDNLSLVDKGTGKEFAQARIMSLYVKTLGQIDQGDYDGHETYMSLDDLLQAFRKFYGDKVTPETEVKILQFELL